jgi:2-iminobutanoate/2-iminopropanoate deaminase
MDDVIRVGVFLTSMESFAGMNAVYARFFREPYPARTTVAVKELPLGAAVEIEMIVLDER